MRRWINWQDIITFGGLPFVATGLAIGTLLTSQDWHIVGAFILASVVLTLWLIFGMLFWSRWRERPDIVTLMGTAVWVNGMSITADEVTDAINFYAHNVAHAHRLLDVATVLSMFAHVSVEFITGPIWFGGHERSGIQKGYAMRVRWQFGEDKDGQGYLEGFGYNAFFHECHHMVDEMLFNIQDHKHERLDWWDMIPKLKQTWRDGGFKKISTTERK